MGTLYIELGEVDLRKAAEIFLAALGATTAQLPKELLKLVKQNSVDSFTGLTDLLGKAQQRGTELAWYPGFRCETTPWPRLIWTRKSSWGDRPTVRLSLVSFGGAYHILVEPGEEHAVKGFIRRVNEQVQNAKT